MWQFFFHGNVGTYTSNHTKWYISILYNWVNTLIYNERASEGVVVLGMSQLDMHMVLNGYLADFLWLPSKFSGVPKIGFFSYFQIKFPGFVEKNTENNLLVKLQVKLKMKTMMIQWVRLLVRYYQI